MMSLHYNGVMAYSGNTSQNAPAKRRNFTTVLHDPNQWQNAIDFVEACPKYAYIKHDKGVDSANPHYHFYFEFQNPRSFKTVAADLGVPVHMVERPRNTEGLLYYLTHQDKKSQKEGKQVYHVEDISTNLPDTAFQAPLDKQKFWDLCVELADEFRKGNITYREYMSKLSPNLVNTMTAQGIASFTFKVAMAAPHTSDDFDRVPNVETPFGSALGTADLTNVPSSMFQNKPIQRSMFPRDPAA